MDEEKRPADAGTEPSDEMTMDRETYDMLFANNAFLQALLAAGVDQWEGYSKVLDVFCKELGEGKYDSNSK